MRRHPAELFDELWSKYHKKIYTYFRRQFDEHTSEDLCQQTYLNAWRYISLYSENSIKQNKSWLFTVAKNVKNDHLRYIQLHSMNFRYENLYETDVTVEINIDESISIQNAFARLSEEERQLLSMAQYLTSKEIGSVLGISASAVRNRTQNAKGHLKKLLEDLKVNV
ncbi:MAG: RNA polymerase sigma factor [Clostridia bacterium]|nr:RNA polymerase sigma factor [Clostridia bacterium]